MSCQSQTILIIATDQDFLTALELRGQQIGWKVSIASDASAALSLAASCQPNAICLNVDL